MHLVPFFLCFASNTFVALVSFVCEVLWYWYVLHVPTIIGWTCVLGLPRDRLYNIRYDCTDSFHYFFLVIFVKFHFECELGALILNCAESVP
jgi:hypothetical protein